MDNQLLEIFSEESQEIIDALEQGLIELEDNQDPELINAVFRAAHTMKGSAGIVGFDNIVDLTHLMESLLDEMRNGNITPEAEVVGLLLTAVDALKVLLQGYLGGETPAKPEEVMSALSASLDALKGGAGSQGGAAGADQAAQAQEPAPVSDSGEQRYHITLKFNQNLFASGTDPLQFFLELEEMGRIEKTVCHSENLPLFEEFNGDDLYLWWELWLVSSQPESTLKEVFLFVWDESQITIEPLGREEPVSDGSSPKEPEAAPDEEFFPAELPPEKNRQEQAPSANAGPEQTPQQERKPLEKTAPSPTPAPQKAQEAMKPTPQAKTKALTRVAKPAAHSATIRVETDKLDKLVNLVGELVIGVARVNQIAGSEASDELGGAVEALDHISRDLQEQVMRVRMIPVEGTFQRFQRVVRDLAGELGKKIRLKMSGTETELDKNVIEQIADPLKHLIRNSADHGLEPPDERIAAGKPERGTVWLKAYQQEGKIIIEVTDDGRGIDREKILNKAIERGLASPGVQLSDSEVFSFMFQPGFSTAAKVTEVSGRGVGLDVVRKNIEDLRGSVEIDSVVGQGSTFRIKLPLTLAIIDGMTVRIGEEILTIPLLSILESLRPKKEEIRTVEGRGELVTVRGEFLPLVRLYDVFELPTERTDPTQALVVIIESVSKRFGVLVDDILGEQQAVIKSLEQNYKKMEGVAGATILGDGRVSLILDIHGLEKMAFGQ